MSYGWKYTPLGAVNPLPDDDVTARGAAQFVPAPAGLPSGRGSIAQPIALPGIVVRPAGAGKSLPTWAWAAIGLLVFKLVSSRG